MTGSGQVACAPLSAAGRLAKPGGCPEKSGKWGLYGGEKELFAV